MTPKNHALEQSPIGVDGILPRARREFHPPARWEDVNMWRLRFFGAVLLVLFFGGAWVFRLVIWMGERF